MNTREQWILFAKLLENRARETKASGLAASAIALMGAAADATAVARAIGCLTEWLSAALRARRRSHLGKAHARLIFAVADRGSACQGNLHERSDHTSKAGRPMGRFQGKARGDVGQSDGSGAMAEAAHGGAPESRVA